MSLLKRIFLGMGVLGVGMITSSKIGYVLFKRNVKTEVELLFDNLDNHPETVLEEDLVDLPGSVKRWLNYSGIIGREKLISARLKQQAKMKLDVDGPWIPVDAEQYITSSKPGFIWSARIKPFPFVHIAGRDKYLNGSGNMLIKPLSLFTLADSKGEEIDQGTLLRYLAEIVWIPSAALSEYISWETIDENNAKATMTFEGTSASGVFTVNNRGEVIKFEAERYGDFDGEFRIETWSTSVGNYKLFEGIKVPTKGTITWKLDEGDFTWFTFELLTIEYNDSIV